MRHTSAKLNNDDILFSDKYHMDNDSNNMSIAQVYVFKHEECLGWDCFFKDTITIGNGSHADILLDDESINGIHAEIKISNGKIIVSSKKAGLPVYVNGKSIESCVLRSFDFIAVGSHSIKVKLPRISETQSNEEDSIPETIPEENMKTDQAESVICMPMMVQQEEIFTAEYADDDKTTNEKETKHSNEFYFNEEVTETELTSTGKDEEIKYETTIKHSMDNFKEDNVLSERDQADGTEEIYVNSNEITDERWVVEEPIEQTINRAEYESNQYDVLKDIDVVQTENTDQPNTIDNVNGDISPHDKTSTKSHVKASEDYKYRVIFHGECIKDCEEHHVKEKLSGFLKLKKEKIERLFSGQRVIIKKNIDKETAEKYLNIFKAAGARCDIEKMTDAEKNTEQNNLKNEIVEKKVVGQEIQREDHVKLESEESITDPADLIQTSIIQETVEVYWEDAEEETEENDTVSPFLKEVLFDAEAYSQSLSEKNISIEIIKIKDTNIIDVRYLNPSEKYYIHNQQGRYCLAEYKNNKTCYVYFGDRLIGHVQTGDAEQVNLKTYQTPENLYKKTKGIYRLTLSLEDQISVADEDYRYLVRVIKRAQSPRVAETVKEKNPLYKNLLRSSGFHLLVLFIFGLVGMFPEMPEPKGTDSHFVKIDVAELKKETPVVKPTPPEKPPEVKPSVTELAKVTTPPKKQPVPKKKAGGVSSSPNAGGGSGKDGNVLNRNVNETGILGLIGDSIGFTPKEALATVTNLDVVSSPVSSGKNMKVGGIAGKLSTDDISIPTGGVVRSSGSSQVLRSVGVAGDGAVAALKKGETGQNNVMGMVSVDLDKSVRVEGGMSREAVKRIIDQHLDEISFCYENALMDSPTLMGNIVFEWKILMSGKVGEVQIKSSSVRSKEIHSCIKAAIKTWQFPEPSNAEVVVSYPFVFNIVGF